MIRVVRPCEGHIVQHVDRIQSEPDSHQSWNKSEVCIYACASYLLRVKQSGHNGDLSNAIYIGGDMHRFAMNYLSAIS